MLKLYFNIKKSGILDIGGQISQLCEREREIITRRMPVNS